MLRRFCKDVRGNFAMMTGIAMVPIMGALAVAIDYSQLSRQRQDTLNALDAAGIATARQFMAGDTEAVVKAYANKFFEANLASVTPANSTLTVILPANPGGTPGRIKLTAGLKYQPYFLPPFLAMLNTKNKDYNKPLDFYAESTVQLKNTAEVALVLDNSGSMDYYGTGSGKKRIDLLKSAATQLVEQLAAAAGSMKGVENPIQFSLVPFAASVNVGAGNSKESWMDTEGISPIHHENFDWGQMAIANANKKVDLINGKYYKKGSGWPTGEQNTVMTRFQLFEDIKRLKCANGTTTCSTPVVQKFASWAGCVESRQSPLNTDDTPASIGDPRTLYVPMFAPDEAGDFKDTDSKNDNLITFKAYNTWWYDSWANNTNNTANARNRQKYTPKYYVNLPKDIADPGSDKGPNASCTTTPITPLKDVTDPAGMTAIKKAINDMAPLGATNVPEGLAWGWRTLSSQLPFTGGRAEAERGNDKVVIVLTDGANTYYTPDSLGATDTAGNKSIYSAFGYAYQTALSDYGRIFKGTSNNIDKTDFENDTYSAAMNEQFDKTCVNVNGGDTGGTGAGLIVMTVALDLDPNKKPSDPSKAATADEKKQTEKQLAMLKKCASRSRYTKDPDDPSLGKKLFWNATGANLSEVFKAIADELTNMRIVG